MRLFLLLLIVSFPLVGFAQYPNIKIAENAEGGFGPCEPSIAISPQNTDIMVAGAVLDNVYYSHDGGKSWQKDELKSKYGVWGDPCIVADQKGNFYYLHLSNPAGSNWNSEEILDRIVVQKSTDAGKTWSQGSFMGFAHPKDQDKEWAAVEPRNGNLYATWTQFDKYGSKLPIHQSNIMFSKSKDGGETWSDAKKINQFAGNCLDSDSTTEGAVPSVGPKGEIYVAWAFDGNIYFDYSKNKGKSWREEDIIAAKIPGGWEITLPGLGRANGMPVTATDVSKSPYRGSIYINWADQRNGLDDTDVWLAHSRDGGESWSEPVRVNNDPPGKHQFFSWMAVDPATGVIYVVFYDRRAHDGNETDVYLAYSIDGGITFINEKISEKPFTPYEGPFFGDYNNISVHDGKVRPVWTRLEQDTMSVWTAIIDKELKVE